MIQNYYNEGKKKMKKVKKITIILAILLLCLVSFIGIYVQKNGMIKSIVKDYDLGMNLEGYRELRIRPAEGSEITSDKVQQVKELLVKRLKKLGSEDYLIKVDYTTGEVVLQLEENTLTDKIVSDIYTAGKLKMADSKDKNTVYMTNEHIKEVSLKYSSGETGTGIYLDFAFTDEGAKIIKDLSTNKYKTIEKEETEKTEEETEKSQGEETKEEEDEQPKLVLMIDNNELVSSSFDFPITEGRLQLQLAKETTDAETIQSAVANGNAIAATINYGPLPIEYKVGNNTYVYSDITNEARMIFVIAIAIIVLIAIAVLIIKYKTPALLSGISYIGFIALYLLVLRYANVVISLEGIAGILVILIINYLLIKKLLSEPSIKQAFKDMGIQLIPVIAVIIAFSFINWTNIASFGMTMFWGLLLTPIYNFVVTQEILKK